MADLRLLSKSQLPQAGRVLTDAFHDDPVWSHVVADPAERRRAMPDIWRAVVRGSIRQGQVFATPDVAGVACWLRPGKTNLNAWRAFRSGFFSAMSRFSRETRQRLSSSLQLLDVAHKRVMPKPHWYLWAVGVTPEQQGAGIGSALLRPILQLASESGVPCYLETESEWHVEFYRRRGFEVTYEDLLPFDGPPVWGMVRPALTKMPDPRVV